MAVLKVLTFSCFLLIIFGSYCGNATKLNVPRVLLPLFNEFSVNFTLEVTEGGCYRWSTTRIDLLQLVPLDIDWDRECSSRVVIYAISREQSRNIAVVLAEEVHSGQILRCDVIVDVINSLSITTTTRELFMHEAPEAFEVRAYDNQGNEFSTLDGVVFEWSIVSLKKKKNLSVLRFMTFKESTYEAHPSITALEDQNKRGYTVLLEGVKTGSAKVMVRLPYPEYNHIETHSVNLTVVANLMLMPADVCMMVGDVVKFKVIHMNNGRLEEILLPNSQYFLSADSVILVSVDKNTGELTALKEGDTKAVLHDVNIDESDPGVRLPTSTVHIVKPSYLVLNILPHRNWVILLSDHHDIVAEIYSENDHKMHVGSGVEIHTQVTDLFHVQQRSLNGSWVTGWGVEEGIGSVKAVLESVIHPKRGRYSIDPPLTNDKDLYIYSRISVTPEVILPWDPVIKPKYDIQLTASGGDGQFIWSSSNHTLGVVTQTGLVRTQSNGAFNIYTAMMRNHHNRETVKFHLLTPDRLEIVEYVMEAEIMSPIHLYIALYTKKPGSDEEIQIPFTRCQELAFKVKLSDSTHFVENKTAITKPIGISCANIAVVGLAVGTTRVTVSYKAGEKLLEDSVTVSAYKPLKLVQPYSCEVVLAVGSSFELLYSGGPKPLLGRPSEHKHVVSTADEGVVTVADITQMSSDSPEHELTAISVLCHKLGETEVTLSITNTANLPNCINTESVAKVWVICGRPRSVVLQPRMKVADAQSCPMDLSSDRIAVQSYQDIELDVIVKDQDGRRFLNISSLKFEWKMNPKEAGEFAISNSVLTQKNIKNCGLDSFQRIKPKISTGTIDVTVSVPGYLKNVLSKNKINPEWPEFVGEEEKGITIPKIVTTISLYLVDDTVVLPNMVSLYNFPGNRKVLYVSQGSGYFELALSADDIAEVNYVEGSRKIEIFPIKDGELKISVKDLCLVSRPAVISVNVISVNNLRVEVSDKVEIGKCISCVLKLYDENDNPMMVPDSSLLNIMVHVDDPIINVEKLPEDPENPWNLGEVHYIITGIELGDTKVTFSMGGGEEVVESAPADIQVFPPLRLSPKNGTIVVGAVFQYTTKGGPQPDSNLEYTVVSSNVASIKPNGIVQGTAVGHTKITAKAVGIHPATGHKLLYSEDSVDLYVITVSGIKISAPSLRIQVGAAIPVWATGLPEQLSPVILGSLEPPITFEWSLDDPNIADAYTMFSHLGIRYDKTDQVVIRIKGKEAGRTRLALKATVPGIATNFPKKNNITFTSSVEIDVVEKLLLIEPDISSSSYILIPPHTTLQLKTNLDDSVMLHFGFPGNIVGQGEDDNSKSLAVRNAIISVSETGSLSSHDVCGQALLLITSVDDLGLKQTISIAVEVKQIHFMLLSAVSNWQIQPEEPVITLPTGTEFELRATYHDNIGNVFTTSNAPLKTRSSRLDLVRVRPGTENSSVIISTRKPGYTVLKVWAEGIQKTADYVKLNVQHSTMPTVDFLTTGDIACMHAPVVDKTNRPGKWCSNDYSVIAVREEDGVAYAVGTRESTVFLTNSLLPAAPLQSTILPVSEIEMIPVADILTNAKGMSPYKVPLVLLSCKCKNKQSNLINKSQCKSDVTEVLTPFPFICHVKFTNNSVAYNARNVFSVKSNFHYDIAYYTCDISPGAEFGPNVSTLQTNVSVWATVEGLDVTVDAVEVHFIPAIYLEEEIVFSEKTQSADLFIYGVQQALGQVTVNPIDPKLLEVKRTTKRVDEGVVKYQIRLLDWHWKLREFTDSLSVIVTSPVTNQIVKVHIKTDHLSGFQCPASHGDFIGNIVYNYRHIIVVVGSTFVLLGVTFYVYSVYFQPVVNVNINPNRSLLSCISPCQARCAMPPSSPYTPNPCLPQRSITPSDSVYGNASQFYNSSPEYRRNRRLM